jgi:hypothetical protein
LAVAMGIAFVAIHHRHRRLTLRLHPRGSGTVHRQGSRYTRSLRAGPPTQATEQVGEPSR